MAHLPGASDLEHRIDLTPMIDVVFLMIVFFLCIPFRTLAAKQPAFLPLDRGGSGKWDAMEALSVRIVCEADGRREPDGRAGSARHRLVGHRVRWALGPRPVGTAQHLMQELAQPAAAPECQVIDPATQQRKLMMCVIEPGVGVCYDDVARTADVARAAGFRDVTFDGGVGRR